MVRMLIVGYCMGIRSERRLCEEVHPNLAYRWFCRLGLDGKAFPITRHSQRNRHGRFREKAICCVICSESGQFNAAWQKGWWAADGFAVRRQPYRR